MVYKWMKIMTKIHDDRASSNDDRVCKCGTCILLQTDQNYNYRTTVIQNCLKYS